MEAVFTCTDERRGLWALTQAAILGSSAVTRSLVSSAARGARSTNSLRRKSRAAARPLLRSKQDKCGEASAGRPRTASGWGAGFYPPASGKSATTRERARQEDGEEEEVVPEGEEDRGGGGRLGPWPLG